MVTKLKDEATRLWETMTKIAEASQKLSDNCHALQVDTVVRAAEAFHAESEDAKQSANDGTLSMADRLKVENPQLDVEIAAVTAKTAALDEEFDQASPKSPPRSPRGTEQQEGVAGTTSSAHPKAAGCLPTEEQPESKR